MNSAVQHLFIRLKVKLYKSVLAKEPTTLNCFIVESVDCFSLISPMAKRLVLANN